MLREVRDVLTKEECNTIIDYCRPRLKKSKVVGGDVVGESPISHSHRTNSGCWIKSHDYHTQEFQEIIEKVRDTITQYSALPSENQEYPYQVLNYQVGEYYKLHQDYFERNNEYWKYVQSTGGQRAVSILLYLNDVEEGGEIEYPHIQVKIKPEIGKMIIHQNMKENKELKESMHEALPVLRGEKWVLVNWVRVNKYTK